MLRLLLGLSLLPSSLIGAWVAAQALGRLASASAAAAPFIAGFASALLARVFIDLDDSRPGRLLSYGYVVGHELTHALAAWAGGGSVYSFKAGARGGHVDLSSSGLTIALAPYCVPLYALAVVAAYRALTWAYPAWAWRPGFLFLLGLALSFHLVFTVDTLWGRRQPDLDAAGGAVFSLALIAGANALCVLLLLKALFPRTVGLEPCLRQVWELSRGFWSGAAALGAARQ